MIIADTEGNLTAEELTTAPSNNIYYNSIDGTYNRKGIGYNYTEINYIYQKISLDKSDYEPGVYFLKNGNSYNIAEDEYDNTAEYYKKVCDPSTARWS